MFSSWGMVLKDGYKLGAKMAIKMGNVERMEYVNNIKQLNVIGRGS